jgi:hypothetical protein
MMFGGRLEFMLEEIFLNKIKKLPNIVNNVKGKVVPVLN